ncbi:MAG: penicillin-binding protein 2 [Pseudomonadota bacterium]|jgi:penicillin-binding protein 2
MWQDSFRDSQQEQALFRSRAAFMAIVVLIMAALLAVRMAYLQVTLHQKYRDLSENNRLQLRPINPKRGLIFDRNGVILAANTPSYSLTLVVERALNPPKTLDFLNELVGLRDRKQIEERIKQRRPFEPIILRQRLNEEDIAKIMVNRHFLPGVDIEAQLIRHYPQGDTFAHVLGYVGRINQQEQAHLDKDPELKRRYSASQFIGKLGIEKHYEQDLHGDVGYEKVETNARGRAIRVVERIPPTAGQDITLQLDSRLQQLAQKEMQGMRGALVAIEIETGGILSIYSNPSFDPNAFVTGISSADYSKLRDNPDNPLFDRTTRGQYPPASTLKPFMGLAVLNSGATTWRETIRDFGHFQLPKDERIYRDWKREGHGIVNMERAIVESCDIFFYEMATRSGIDNIYPFLAQFGFGRDMTYDVSNALPGLLPGREWKRAQRRSFWYPGDTVNLGIGQGFMLVTPLQMATATAVLASNGKWQIPRLIAAHNEAPALLPHGDIPDIVLKDPNNWTAMHNAMGKVISDPRGTAHRLNQNKTFNIAGKTGTAQVVGIAQDAKYDSASLRERLRDHALFIAFAPVEKPKIAIAVIIENGESATRTAAPIAKAIIDEYLGGSEG